MLQPVNDKPDFKTPCELACLSFFRAMLNPKYVFTLSLLILGNCFLHAQSKYKFFGTTSEKVYLSVFKEPVKPPRLLVQNISFSDENGNLMLNANENGEISFTLTNNGTGEAMGLSVALCDSSRNAGLSYSKSKFINNLKPGDSCKVTLPISGTLDLKSGIASFVIKVNEANGFNSDARIIDIPTEEFKAPLVHVVDYMVKTVDGGGLRKKEPFSLEVMVKNDGEGVAKNVSVTVEQPVNVAYISGRIETRREELEAGGSIVLEYSFATTDLYEANIIPIKFNIEESFGKYAIDTVINFEINQYTYVERTTIQAIARKDNSDTKSSLSSDIDKNMPISDKKYPNKVALIFGNENYQVAANPESNVDYARNDANVFKEYTIKTLGLKKENVFCFFDATAGVMNAEIERVAGIVRNMGPEAELIFYYAGHGQPDDNKVPFLVPTDVNITTLTTLGIPLRKVYEKLGGTGVGKITAVIDACFSGAGRREGLIASSRSVRIKPQKAQLSENMVVFSATTNEQRSLPYHREKHGMFTYFFLKKIQKTKGEVSYGELFDFVKKNVGITSNREEGVEQTPVVEPGYNLRETWRGMTF